MCWATVARVEECNYSDNCSCNKTQGYMLTFVKGHHEAHRDPDAGTCRATMTMSGWAVGQPVPAGHRTVPPIAMLPPPPLLQIADAQAQPVRLAAMKLDVRVVGRLARSTVELTFQNPDGRVLEGKLQFPLLDGQQVFEEVTRTRVDPALLEATQGNNFKLRLYPIPANGERKVSITLTERLPVGRDGKATLRLPDGAKVAGDLNGWAWAIMGAQWFSDFCHREPGAFR